MVVELKINSENVNVDFILRLKAKLWQPWLS
jgi:hypothetical protein